MYRKKPEIRLFVYPAVAGLLLLAGMSFIKTPLTLSTYAEIFPKEKWLLTRGGNGEIISNHIDYTNGRLNSYSIANFERGEYVSLRFSKFLGSKKEISAGDTIAVINSSNLQDQLMTALAQLEIAAANLDVQKSPSKQSVIAEAEYKLQASAKKIDEQKIIFERTKQLHTKGFASQQEYDLQKNTLDLLELEYRVNEASVTTLKTGVKPEEISLLETQIKAARTRINYLRGKENEYTVIAPFSGSLIPSFSPDTLLYASDRSDVVLHIPLSLNDINGINENSSITVSFPEFNFKAAGKVLNIDKEVKMIERRQAVFISVLLPNTQNRLLQGMVLKCEIELQTVSLLTYLYETAKH